ncbi:MAG: Gfo/Idh/MocA family protein [Eggerthellaceae bacterium]|jgi:1,5-anhydro-D-fructose reductase (1,5-anhydro-D-mannitol-forming)
MGADKVIRWGIIGCGNVVETKNGPATWLAQGSELAGIYNRTRSKAQDFTSRYGHGRVYDTMEELLADPSIDIVYVATPPNCHLKEAKAVAEAGKHCYLEKPIALSWEEGQQIRATFQKSGTRCFVAHYRRGMPRYRKAKELIDAGTLGKVRGVQIIRTQRQTLEETLPYPQKPWRVKPEISGGCHFYEGDAHMLDLVDFLVGPLAHFQLEVTNETHVYEREDAVALSGITEGRALVSCLWCYAAYRAIDRFLIFGDQGSMEFPYYDNAAPLHIETLADRNAVTYEGVMGGVRKEAELTSYDVETTLQEYPGLGQIQDIVDELRGVPGGKCRSTLDSALRTLRITSTAEQQMLQLIQDRK